MEIKIQQGLWVSDWQGEAVIELGSDNKQHVQFHGHPQILVYIRAFRHSLQLAIPDY